MRAKILYILIIFFVIYANNAISAEIEIPLNYDNAWKSTLQAVILEGNVKLKTSDKNNGIIQAEKISSENSKYYTCPKLVGVADSYTLNITATVNTKTSSSSIVSVHVEGIRKYHLNKHLLFVTIGRLHKETQCQSTGMLEKKIFNRLSK